MSGMESDRITDQAVGEGLWIRGAAKVIDLVILSLITGLNSLVFMFLLGVMAALGGAETSQQAVSAVDSATSSLDSATFSNMLIGLIMTVMWYTILEGVAGTTPGKWVLGLFVVREDGSPCDLKAALLRSAGLIVDLLFFGVIGAISISRSPKRQRRGDVYGKTLVVKRAAIIPGAFQPTAPFVAALLGAVVVNFGLVALQIGMAALI